jgi:hypothetical protein
MLIDSDGHGGGEASAAPTDAEGLFKRLKRDIKAYHLRGLTDSTTMRASASLPAA